MWDIGNTIHMLNIFTSWLTQHWSHHWFRISSSCLCLGDNKTSAILEFSVRGLLYKLRCTPFRQCFKHNSQINTKLSYFRLAKALIPKRNGFFYGHVSSTSKAETLSPNRVLIWRTAKVLSIIVGMPAH